MKKGKKKASASTRQPGKALIIAEKPSVAAELSRALSKAPGMSKFKEHSSKDYFENDSHIISAAIGHLVELPLPTEGGRRMKWDMEKLPIIPETFELKPIDRTKKRFNLLKKLMKDKNVELLINSCDAGREGELIFRYLVEAAEVQKPMKRLWMQSMTAQALIDAFTHLRSEEEMLPLSAAAKCRSESDWLVGINGSRALTAFNSRYGGFVITPVGRVQTPTLTILVNREREIDSFEERTYFEIHAGFDVSAGTYPSRWLDEGFKKSDDPGARAERIWDRGAAEAIVERCRDKEGLVEEKTKPKSQSPPLLFDLTSLQRDASNRFGFSAKRTLQIAQSLYERHKALTYPRTDSQHLPQDYPAVVGATLKSLSGEGSGLSDDLKSLAGKIIGEKMVKPGNKRVFNDSKVSDHFAIIPTGKLPGKSLNDAERKIYDTVTLRFMAVFFGPAKYDITTRTTRVGDDAFRTTGKVLLDPGWLAVYGKEAQNPNSTSEDGKTAPLVPLAPDEKTAANSSIEMEEKATKPPARYNEATLLSAMESAGKMVENEELRAAMSERGLGTPATRADIIQGLIHDKYVQRDGRSLVATAKGIRLIDLLETIGLDALCAPELTGKWEFKLKEMEQGRLDRKDFMSDIRKMTENIVERIRDYIEEINNLSFPDLDAACPVCGASPLKQTDAHYSCPAPECRFRIGKVVASRQLTVEEAKELLAKGQVGPLEGLRSRAGGAFSAIVEFDDKFKTRFVFEDRDLVKPDFEDPLCACPRCLGDGREGTIHAAGDFYVCENYFEEPQCPARLPHTLLKAEISREEALKFFSEGKTGVIDSFISKKRGRSFSASLLLKKSGPKLFDWEFPPSRRKKKASGS